MTSARRSTRNTKVKPDPYANAYGPCPSPPVIQDKYFYSSHPNSPHPRSPIVNERHPTSSTPEYITSLRFDPLKWHAVRQPPNWIGPWPPTSATHLMAVDFDISLLGTPPQQRAYLRGKGDFEKDFCLGKWCWQAPIFDDVLCARDFTAATVCNHSFEEWVQGCADWQSRFEIRAKAGMGYGLYSKCGWVKGDLLGPYLGEVVPVPGGNTDYCHAVT